MKMRQYRSFLRAFFIYAPQKGATFQRVTLLRNFKKTAAATLSPASKMAARLKDDVGEEEENEVWNYKSITKNKFGPFGPVENKKKKAGRPRLSQNIGNQQSAAEGEAPAPKPKAVGFSPPDDEKWAAECDTIRQILINSTKGAL